MPRPLPRIFFTNFYRFYSVQPTVSLKKPLPENEKWVPKTFESDGKTYIPDPKYFNLTENTVKLMQRRLLFEDGNPLNLLKRRIVNHFYKKHRKIGSTSPLFTVCEDMHRVVTTFENFDSLLTPEDHVSRKLSDSYYVNEDHCLRAHTSAHQFGLMKQGLDNFLVIGDVYRRDEVDKSHYPCFHQMEGVRLYSHDELFETPLPGRGKEPKLFEETGQRTPEKQERLSPDAAKLIEIKLKETLEDLAKDLFGADTQMRWVDAYFPFTHPSFELEVFYNDKWLEVLGCGVIEQKIIDSAGISSKAGWAFGLGLERLAMVLYKIPDIRIFWSKDTGVLHQFQGKDPSDAIEYVPVALHLPQLYMDLSFWLPEGADPTDMKSNAYDVIRNVGGDLIEQVQIIDEFFNPKKKLHSHCYRITYRSNERVLTKDEVNVIHGKITGEFVRLYDVKPR